MNTDDYSLIYVMDAYCGWCYGFSESIQKFHKKHPELTINVISGGLFIGDRNISEVTEGVFGNKYKELLEDGTFVVDSEGPAID